MRFFSTVFRFGHSPDVKTAYVLFVSSLIRWPRRWKKDPWDAILGPAIISPVGIVNFGSSGDELAVEMKFTMFCWTALSAPSKVF